MGSDIEMDAPSKLTTPHLSRPNTSSEQIFDQTAAKQDVEAPIASNGTQKSKVRMFAILTALFVRFGLLVFQSPRILSPQSCSQLID